MWHGTVIQYQYTLTEESSQDSYLYRIVIIRTDRTVVQ
jgi:hypothetical protein